MREVTLAPPGPGEALIDVAACAICHSDIHFATGAWGGDLPAVYGHEAAGTVSEVGPDVGDVAVGDRVVVTLIRSCGACAACLRGQEVFCGATFPLDETSPITDPATGETLHHGMRTGAFASQVVVHTSQLAPIGDDIGFAEASLLACGVLTGYGAVTKTSSAGKGADVVVVGCGGVGLNAIQGAVAVGAERIVAVDVVDAKLESAVAFGATATVNAAAETDSTTAVLEALGSGGGASHVFVTVGSGAAIQGALAYLRPGGELVIVGMPESGVTIDVDPSEVAAAGYRIVGSKMGSACVGTDIEMLADRYRSGDLLLTELISGTFPLSEINAAIAEVASGDALRNVIVFDPESDQEALPQENV